MSTSQETSGETSDTPPPNGNELPDAAVRLKDEGNRLFKESHFNDAIERYSDAISLCPDQNVKALSTWYVNRALCHLRIEAYGSARADAKRAIELDPRNPKAYYRLGSAHVALGHYKEGLAEFTKVCKMLPTDKDAKAKYDLCLKEVKRKQFEDAIATEETLLPTQKFELDKIQVEDSYKGPRWDGEEGTNFIELWEERNPAEKRDGTVGVGGITKEFVEEAVALMKAQGKIHRKYVLKLLLCAKSFLRPLPSLVPITIPAGKSLNVCGDVHGQFYDLLNLFELAGGYPTRENPFLFNGDFVDRGSFSVEVILTLLLFKCLDPRSVHLLRGNHETKNMNKIYGFEGEVKHKYDPLINDVFTEIFRYLPLCATLNKKVVVMHGGLFQRDGVTLDEISKIPRFCEPPDQGLFSDILWSDPQPFDGRSPSKRGVGQSFGPDVTKRFLQDNGLDLLVRSHEVRDEGYLVEHDGKLITVFSAPNYCDQMGNKGAFIRFIGGENNTIESYSFKAFTAVPHPHVPPMAFAGNMSMFGL